LICWPLRELTSSNVEVFLFTIFVPRIYNVFNVVTYSAPTSEFNNVNFGKVTSAMASRSLQLGARVYF